MGFRFPAGGYHSSAWDTHANEAVPEWPPSPWRILRALIATWYHKRDFLLATEPELALELEEQAFADLIEALAVEAPSYLTAANLVTGHTRHYMPVAGKPVKLIDSFVHLGGPGLGGDADVLDRDARPQIVVRWPVELSDAQRAVIAALLKSISYLGRAEGLEEADLISDRSSSEGYSVVHPLKPDEKIGRDEEPVRLLLPEASDRFRECLASQPASGSGKGRGRSKKASLPSRILEALQVETGPMRAAGWSQPPGSRWMTYARPAEPFRRQVGVPHRKRMASIKVVRFALVSSVPPQITKALQLTNAIHRTLCALTAGRERVFTGCDDDRQPLSGHDHAYILPEADARGAISHITFYARMGFSDNARHALDALNRLDDLEYIASRRAPSLHKHLDDLRKRLGTGSLAPKLVMLTEAQPVDFRNASPLFAQKSRVWTSLTPFVPVRHPKAKHNGTPKLDAAGVQIGSAPHDLIRLLCKADGPFAKDCGYWRSSIQVEQIPELGLAGPLGSRSFRWLQFTRVRGLGPHRDDRAANEGGVRVRNGRGYGFRISFPEAVSGPICVGYAAHFGLGLFMPCPDSSNTGGAA